MPSPDSRGGRAQHGGVHRGCAEAARNQQDFGRWCDRGHGSNEPPPSACKSESQRERPRRPRMQYVNLGSTGMRVSRVCLGMMSYGQPREPGMGARRGRGRADREASRRGRDHVLRHRRCLQRRPERGADRSSDAQPVRDARGVRRRDEGVGPVDARRERLGAFAQAHHGFDRRVPEAARARLRRSLPDPSLGLDHADRGDDGRASRRCEGRQGALHRRQQHVRVAVREGAVGREHEVCLDAESLQPRSTARRSAR